MNRAKTTLRGQAGAFDLPSIIVGVVVVAILTAGVLAAVFAVIPWSQDNAAKQDLDSVRTAQGVAQTGADNAPPPGYKSLDELVNSHLLPAVSKISVATNTARNCYVAAAKSGSGKVWYNTSKTPEAKQYTTGDTTPDCSVPLIDVVAGLPTGPGGDSGGVLPPAPPVASGEILLNPTKADNVVNKRAVSGNGVMTTDPGPTMTGWGSTDNPGNDTDLWNNDGSEVTLSYYDAATGFTPFYTHTMDSGSGTSVEIIQHDKNVYSNFVDTSSTMTPDEVAGFQKLLDNGGKVSFKPAGGTTDAVFVYGPTKDTSGYESWATWPVGTYTVLSTTNKMGDASGNDVPTESITQTFAGIPAWDLIQTPDDNGKIYGTNTTTATWTIDNVTLRADKWWQVSPPGGDYIDIFSAQQMKITVDQSTDTMTVQYLRNTLSDSASGQGLTFADVPWYIMSTNVTTKQEFDHGGYHWTMNLWATIY